jgi:hypothetical protein
VRLTFRGREVAFQLRDPRVLRGEDRGETGTNQFHGHLMRIDRAFAKALCDIRQTRHLLDPHRGEGAKDGADANTGSEWYIVAFCGVRVHVNHPLHQVRARAFDLLRARPLLTRRAHGEVVGEEDGELLLEWRVGCARGVELAGDRSDCCPGTGTDTFFVRGRSGIQDVVCVCGGSLVVQHIQFEHAASLHDQCFLSRYTFRLTGVSWRDTTGPMTDTERRIETLRRFIKSNEERVATEPDGAAGAVASSYLKRDRAELAELLAKVAA